MTIHDIKATAKANGIPLAKLCRDAGVNFSTVWRWLNSKTDPSPEKLAALQAELIKQIGRQ